MSALPPRSNLVDRIESLLNSIDLGPTAPMETLAKSMKLSVRTLRRRLAEQQTTFREILSNWRNETSKRLLRQRTDLEISDISRRLGYAHPSNFERAFKRWTGVSPGKYRNSRRDLSGPK